VARVLFTLLTLGVVAVVGADPPPLESQDAPFFTADILTLREEDQTDAMVWLVLNIPLESIFFEPGADHADVSISWKVLRGNRQVDGDVVVQRVNVDERDGGGLGVLQTVPLSLPADRYRVEIEVGQPGSDKGARVERELRIDATERTEAALSSLYFCAMSPHQVRRYNDGLPGFPLVTRIVNENVEVLSLVGELYAPDGCSERFRVTYRLVDDYERTVQERTEDVPCEGFATLMVLPLDTSNLSFGDYRVEVSVDVPDRGDDVRREIWFSVDESLLPLRAGFSRTLELIEMIATPEELDALKNTPVDEREEAWDAFWESRDPNSATPVNEFQDDFFRRLRYANQHFGTAVLPGWKTDRGYVVLKYGDPDRIERSSLSIDAPAVETWLYDDLGRRFVFVDDEGLGDFRLQRGDSM